MNRPEKSLSAATLFLASVLYMAAQDIAVAPPAKNWTLPLFTKEGYHQMTLRGDEVHPVDSDRVDIVGMDFTAFTGGPDARVDSVLLSPAATFMINERIVRGDGSVRLIRDDIEVTGEKWSYDYKAKKVLIMRNSHVVFHAALPDILK